MPSRIRFESQTPNPPRQLMNIIKTLLFSLILTLLALPDSNANPSPYTDEQEAALVQEIATELQLAEPVAGEPKYGHMGEWEGVAMDYEAPNGKVTFYVNEEGRVEGVSAQGATMTNDTLRKLAGFSQLKALYFGHWGNWGDKSIPKSSFDGSGLEALSGLPIEIFSAGGSMFNEVGFAHVRWPTLRRLTLHHVKISEEALGALSGHPQLEYIELSSMGKPQFTDSTIPLLMTFPQIKEIALHESYLTYEGLSQLQALNGQLEKLFFRWSLITPEDVEKLRALLPETEIVVHAIKDLNQGHMKKFKDWAPPEVLAKFE